MCWCAHQVRVQTSKMSLLRTGDSRSIIISRSSSSCWCWCCCCYLSVFLFAWCFISGYWHFTSIFFLQKVGGGHWNSIDLKTKIPTSSIKRKNAQKWNSCSTNERIHAKNDHGWNFIECDSDLCNSPWSRKMCETGQRCRFKKVLFAFLNPCSSSSSSCCCCFGSSVYIRNLVRIWIDFL